MLFCHLHGYYKEQWFLDFGWESASPWEIFFLSPWIVYTLFIYFWPCRVACGILAPRLGTELGLLAVEAQTLNHWTAKQVPPWEIFFNPDFQALSTETVWPWTWVEGGKLPFIMLPRWFSCRAGLGNQWLRKSENTNDRKKITLHIPNSNFWQLWTLWLHWGQKENDLGILIHAAVITSHWRITFGEMIQSLHERSTKL